MTASLRRASAIVVVSRATAAALKPSGIPPQRVRVIHNGIELERYSTDGTAAGLQIRAEWGFGSSDPLILAPAVMREGKGHDLLLDAMPRIIAQVPRARLLLAGTGPLEGALRERARVYGAAVVFLGHRSDVPSLLGAADLVVLASQSEALPTVLMEAAAAGRPVVSTRVGGVQEVVVDRQTGLLVPPGDAAALAAAVVRVLQDRDLADALGGAARAEAEARFSIDVQVNRTCELWRDITARPAA